MKTLREFATVKEAADFLGVSALTLRRWDKSGKLACRRHPINGYRLYDRELLTKVIRKING